MSLYVIGDLHLSGSVDKPMDKFGSRWVDHADKIRARWTKLVKAGDTVVLPGDFSWGMSLDEAAEDFRFLESLPGRKLLSKGNHDFWWTSFAKMRAFLSGIGVGSVDFLHNNAFRAEGYVLAGSRGWFLEEKQQNVIFPTDYEKLVNREAMRLEASIREAEKLRTADEEILVFLHFPPLWGEFVCEPILDLMVSRGIRRCWFGHIHGIYNIPQVTRYGGLELSLISADYLDFMPQYIFPR